MMRAGKIMADAREKPDSGAGVLPGPRAGIESVPSR